MRFFGEIDPKPFYGVAVVALAGVLAGAAMKPVLNIGDGPKGPQILGPESAPRMDRADGQGSGFAAYRWGIPEYVLGTDWTRPQEVAQTEDAWVEPEAAAYEAPAVEPVRYIAAHYVEPPREPVVYPSMGGGIADDEQRVETSPPEDPPSG
jgi:hypothetical protein